MGRWRRAAHFDGDLRIAWSADSKDAPVYWDTIPCSHHINRESTPSLSAWSNTQSILNKQKYRTAHTITSTKQFKKDLEKVRKQSFGTTIGKLEEGLVAVAAPIFNQHGEVQATLCNGVPSSPVSSEKLNTGSQSVIEESKQISEKIGYQTNDKKNS